MEELRSYVRLVLEAKLEPGSKRIPLAAAKRLAKKLIQAMGLTYVDPSTVDSHTEWMPGVGIPVGSVRRMKADIGDLDIVVTAPVSAQQVAQIPGVEGVTGGAKQINFTYRSGKVKRKVNVFVFLDPKTFGAALLHTAGPQFYNVRIRNVAKSRGMMLSQNGLFKGRRLVAGPTEASVQQALGISNREVQQR